MSTRTPRAPRLKVPVTEEIISDAIPRDSGHCMFAEAIKTAYPDASRVAVDLQTIRFSDMKKGLRFTYLTPRLCQVALVNFDQGTRFEPFEISLKGGQVTLAGARAKNYDKPVTEAQRSQRKSAGQKGREQLKKARLVTRKDRTGNVPEVAGGKPPPLVPGGRRRAFGLRALER